MKRRIIALLLSLALLAGFTALAEELVATQVEAPAPESEPETTLEDITAEPTER